MLNAHLRFEAVVFALAFLILVIFFIQRGKLQLRYALLWIFSALLFVLIAVFPQLIQGVSDLLGFETVSNFVLSVLIFFLLVLSLALTVVTSRQSEKIAILAQELSIEQLSKKNNEKE